jgi:sirohydrochlorin ferrochelatase
MKCLFLAAHGSRMAETNEEVRRLAEAVRRKAGARYSMVTYGFLQFGEPPLADALENCIRDGATDIVLLPYLLAAGGHMAKDIPLVVNAAKAKHPDVRITVAPHVGSAETMPDVILSLVP